MTRIMSWTVVLPLCLSSYYALAHTPNPINTLSQTRVDAVDAEDILSFVNPFIGTTNGGNVFPGQLPQLHWYFGLNTEPFQELQSPMDWLRPEWSAYLDYQFNV